jgi:hypothetical protein
LYGDLSRTSQYHQPTYENEKYECHLDPNNYLRDISTRIVEELSHFENHEYDTHDDNRNKYTRERVMVVIIHLHEHGHNDQNVENELPEESYKPVLVSDRVPMLTSKQIERVSDKHCRFQGALVNHNQTITPYHLYSIKAAMAGLSSASRGRS